MRIVIAEPAYIAKIVAFFQENLDPNSIEIYSEEFVCPLGIQAAIRRKQMVVALVDGRVVGASRFYRKKTANTISLYQFAVCTEFRGTGILKKMLLFIMDAPVVVLCPVASDLNNYFLKTDWMLQKKTNDFNTWVFQ
ncbi:MAG: GNAT family N-acetyltransferase [Psychrobacillus psychrodurans]